MDTPLQGYLMPKDRIQRLNTDLTRSTPSWFYVEEHAWLLESCNLVNMAEDRGGSQTLQKWIKALTREITGDYVPVVLVKLMDSFLGNLQRLYMNQYACPILTTIIQQPKLARHRNYIVDNVVAGNILQLGQDKVGSHLVEASLLSVDYDYFERLCEELLYDYAKCSNNKSALEVLMFDRYGNYVVQCILQRCDIRTREEIQGAAFRHRHELGKYNFGKVILGKLNPMPYRYYF